MDVFKEIENNNIEVLRNLILKNKLNNQAIKKIFNIASNKGYLRILVIMKKYFYLDFINNINFILINLSSNNHNKAVKYLTNKRIIDFKKEKVKLNSDFLTFAAKNGNLDLVKYIVNNPNFSDNVSNNNYNDAVLRAAENNHPEVVWYIISKGCVHYRFVSNRLLMYFSRFGNLKMCKKILNHTKRGIYMHEPFIYACQSGHLDIAEYFLETGLFNPACLNNTSIINAYEEKNEKLVRVLFDDERVKETLKEDSLSAYNYAKRFDIEEKINNF